MFYKNYFLPYYYQKLCKHIVNLIYKKLVFV
uniref:Uncharacterized protein n=1 Tax=Siphoviridae sp. ctrpg19 TaxID=2826481 RepID=A0A8S5MKC0_9CAUD|nr:MAG TPA: hypothetical protein [Siphoviridae sp. ctrpg19]